MGENKRKKYPKLPNGFGQIRYLGEGRRNPYGVYPPATDVYNSKGKPRQKAICYVDDYLKGLTVLIAWKSGLYYPGYEDLLVTEELEEMPETIQKLVGANKKKQKSAGENHYTFEQIYEMYYEERFKHKYGEKWEKTKPSIVRSVEAAYKNTVKLHQREFESLITKDLQQVIDECNLKHSSLELIKMLYNQMYSYGMANNYVHTDYSQYVRIWKEDDDEHGVPFEDEELKMLWEDREDPIAEMLLIMCYSGFRIKEYEDIRVDLEGGYFCGGSKTAAGKNRFVPIHSGIRPLVEKRIARDGGMLCISYAKFRKEMNRYLMKGNMMLHTSHDCRHTFSKLCEKYGVAENDRKRILGHAFKDVTNRVYGHRDIEDLRKEIEKIQFVENLL